MKRYILILFLIAASGIPVQAQQKMAYRSDLVSFKSPDGKITFSGTLTMPEGETNVPAVVIVSGTGKQDRDGMMAGHPLFAQIADHLSKNGIAVLRVDDRGTGKTTGVYETSTTGDFADDALTALRFLKGVDGINSKKIGLMGHSEGGVAIAIAAAKSKDVAFLISIAGLAMSGYDALMRQNEDLVAASAMPDYDKKRSDEINALIFKTVLKNADSDSLETIINTTYARWKIKDDVYFKTLNLPYDHFRFPIYSYTKMATGPWYRYFIKYDAAKTLAKVHVPILALNGDKDLMVAAAQNLANWKSYTAAGGNRKVRTVLLSGLNHLFLPCTVCTTAEYPTIRAGFSERTLVIITRWLQGNI